MWQLQKNQAYMCYLFYILQLPRGDKYLSWMFQRATIVPANENFLPSRFIPPLLSTDLLYTHLHWQKTLASKMYSVFLIQARYHISGYHGPVNLTCEINHLKEWKWRCWQVHRYDAESVGFFISLFNYHLKKGTSVFPGYIPPPSHI